MTPHRHSVSWHNHKCQVLRTWATLLPTERDTLRPDALASRRSRISPVAVPSCHRTPFDTSGSSVAHIMSTYTQPRPRPPASPCSASAVGMPQGAAADGIWIEHTRAWTGAHRTRSRAPPPLLPSLPQRRGVARRSTAALRAMPSHSHTSPCHLTATRPRLQRAAPSPRATPLVGSVAAPSRPRRRGARLPPPGGARKRGGDAARPGSRLRRGTLGEPR